MSPKMARASVIRTWVLKVITAFSYHHVFYLMGDLEGDLEDDLENLTGDLDSSRGFFVEAGPDFEEAGPAFDFLTEAGPGF